VFSATHRSFPEGDRDYHPRVATRRQVRDLLDQGMSVEEAAARLGIRPGTAHLIATGRPVDDAEGPPRQELIDPPADSPSGQDVVIAWVARRAERELARPR
jgi:hypothetical protein